MVSINVKCALFGNAVNCENNTAVMIDEQISNWSTLNSSLFLDTATDTTKG
jgi:hypothetical protein